MKRLNKAEQIEREKEVIDAAIEAGFSSNAVQGAIDMGRQDRARGFAIGNVFESELLHEAYLWGYDPAGEIVQYKQKDNGEIEQTRYLTNKERVERGQRRMRVREALEKETVSPVSAPAKAMIIMSENEANHIKSASTAELIDDRAILRERLKPIAIGSQRYSGDSSTWNKLFYETLAQAKVQYQIMAICVELEQRGVSTDEK